MISYHAYKFLHIAGVFLVLLSAGGLIVGKNLAVFSSSPWRKNLAIANGIGLFLILVAGFGLLARLGVHWPWPFWIVAKLFIWIGFGALAALINRLPGATQMLWWATFLAAIIAAYLANFKPM
jgi:hypothetical protein